MKRKKKLSLLRLSMIGFRFAGNKFLMGLALIFSGLFPVSEMDAQITYKVLFLGNSYTYVNNLPQLVHDLALSAGDTLIFDSHTPGGYQLIDHVQDPISQSKIMSGGWDFVVLQGQSQEPVIQMSQFYSGANSLYNLVKQYNPCAVVMPYMSWGRKNGDAANCAQFPVMCTYQSMDSTLRVRYMNITAALNTEVSPVSSVWNYLRQYHPAIELYHPDESHPSAEGTYAAACSFYAAIFKKNPAMISFNAGLNAADAALIRNAAKTIVYDSLPLWDFRVLPVSDFRYEAGAGNNQINFTAINYGIKQNYFWDFDDGSTATTAAPSHAWIADGSYTISLTTSVCDYTGLHISFTDTVIQFCSHTPTVYTSNPWLCAYDTLWTQPATIIQWLNNGYPVAQNLPYLADYAQYTAMSFSVLTTQNGCTELSQPFYAMPPWSGYYFDAIGNPCIGDTVAFAVLHASGSLTGTEHIYWFKNDTLLSWMINEDTLFITAEGKYECKVVNPASDCPADTTAVSVTYDCGTLGAGKGNEMNEWSLFPNPATETVILKFAGIPLEEQVLIYNVDGRLIKIVPVLESPLHINLGELMEGIYIIKLKNKGAAVKRFIKIDSR